MKKKIGRPPLPNGKAKSIMHGAKFTAAESSRIKRDAKRLGINVSQHVRNRVLLFLNPKKVRKIWNHNAPAGRAKLRAFMREEISEFK
jgi:hypothetical protein